MIDLISTRDGVDAQSRRCAQLLAAVIAQAIKDAAHRPTKEERRNRRNTRHAYRSIKFLFEKNGPFEVYSHLIGMTAESIREALLSRRRLNTMPGWKSLFSDQERRIIQMRHYWYMRDNQPLKASDLTYRENEDEEDH